MINFEEELKKFHPSLEVVDAVYRRRIFVPAAELM